MLNEIYQLPEGFLRCSAKELYQVLPGPTLIHLEGKKKEPMFVSMLLHGNETTGLLAVQRLLQGYPDLNLPRSVSIFVGNVSAARQGLRALPGQLDYNRVWKGEGSPEHAMMSQVVAEMKKRRVFLSVDVHNNSGRNPHYACINCLEDSFYHLATLFSRTVVYFISPDSVQSMAFSELCPSVTIECGHIGDEYGIRHAHEFLDACLHLSQHPDHEIAEHDIDLFHTVAVMKVPQSATIGFGPEKADLRFMNELDELNFRELEPGTCLGWYEESSEYRLQAFDETGKDVSERYIENSSGKIMFKVPAMPSMLTLDKKIIQMDCLGYIMERYPLRRLARKVL